MDYDRQHQLNLQKIAKVLVIGCGGSGVWSALAYAMAGVPRMILFDSDRLEESNLNRLPYPQSFVGMKKTEALKLLIQWLRPECIVLTHDAIDSTMFAIGQLGIEEDSSHLENVLLDCTDDIAVQRVLYTGCKETGIKYIGAHLDGEHVQINQVVPMLGKVEPRGYEIEPSWVAPCLVTGGLSLVPMLVPKFTISSKFHAMGTEEEVFERTKEDANMYCSHQGNWGECDDCDRGDCDSCDRISPEDVDEHCSHQGNWGNCDSCDRISVDNAGEYCPHQDGYINDATRCIADEVNEICVAKGSMVSKEDILSVVENILEELT